MLNPKTMRLLQELRNKAFSTADARTFRAPLSASRDLSKAVGRRIESSRSALNLSVDEIASYAGLSTSMYLQRVAGTYHFNLYELVRCDEFLTSHGAEPFLLLILPVEA